LYYIKQNVSSDFVKGLLIIYTRKMCFQIKFSPFFNNEFYTKRRPIQERLYVNPFWLLIERFSLCCFNFSFLFCRKFCSKYL